MNESAGELDLLRAFLLDRDVACPVCGHNLRGAAGFACPECGGRLNLHVVSIDLPHKWWIWCLLAFAWPLGLLAVFAGAGTWAVAHQRIAPSERLILAGFWAALIFGIVGLIVILRRRTRFVQRSLVWQRVAAITCSLATLAMVVGLLYAFVQIENFYW